MNRANRRELKLDADEGIVLAFKSAGGDYKVVVGIDRDRDAVPFWLGAFADRPVAHGIRCGTRWLIPHVALKEQGATQATQFGRRRKDARRVARENAKSDAERLKSYGVDWHLYRLTVRVFRRDELVGTDSMAGLGESGLPVGRHGGAMDLVELMANDIIDRYDRAS
jgi:hypothetical protein